MTEPRDPVALALLHARCFREAPRPWTAREFGELLAGRGVFLLTRPQGFLLGRAVAGEAELLTLAVAPEARRRGSGAALTAEFAERARALSAEIAFLEVAADNPGAITLYRACGWREAGRRPGYYAPGRDALVMRLPLRPPQEGS